jgi:DNA-binding NarL/FixJ family response regulator
MPLLSIRVRERPAVTGSRLSVTACHAGRARAAVLLASDDAAGAAATALEAAEAADGVGARLDAARSRTLAGKALRAAGERDRAIAELETAETVLADCGAERFHQEAARELRSLGRRPATRSRRGAPDAAGIESLSGRELEVAMLVVDRKTNPEIAADLFLSTKTVESHLRNIFRKLDVSSRVELAWAVELATQR